MKISIRSFIAGVLVTILCTSTIVAAGGIKSAVFNSNKVILDGQELDLGGQQMISVVKDGERDASNYMPVRGVLQAMGYTVEWDGQKQAVIVTSPGKSTPKPIATTKIYLITMDRYDQYWHEMNKGVKDMAEKLNVAYMWLAPETKDDAKQIELINFAVDSGASVILLAANNPYSIADTVAAAKAKGVKFIYLDSVTTEPAIVTLETNNYTAGKLAAEIMLEELGAKTSGTIGIIGVNIYTNSTMRREEGFRDIIEADGRFTLLATKYGNGEVSVSQDAADNFISDNANLVGLYGTNEGAAIGVGLAIKAAPGTNVVGIGFDKSDAILTLLNDGYLKASLAQNPYKMGSMGMEKAYAAMNGSDTGPEIVDVGAIVLKKQ